MRMIVRLRKMETHTRQEQDALLETYRTGARPRLMPRQFFCEDDINFGRALRPALSRPTTTLRCLSILARPAMG
jgi:hypothetical protein